MSTIQEFVSAAISDDRAVCSMCGSGLNTAYISWSESGEASLLLYCRCCGQAVLIERRRTDRGAVNRIRATTVERDGPPFHIYPS